MTKEIFNIHVVVHDMDEQHYRLFRKLSEELSELNNLGVAVNTYSWNDFDNDFSIPYYKFKEFMRYLEAIFQKEEHKYEYPVVYALYMQFTNPKTNIQDELK